MANWRGVEAISREVIVIPYDMSRRAPSRGTTRTSTSCPCSVHVIVDGFEDLRDPFFDSLGEWGPCMGAQFLKCPPYDPVHAEFMRRVGLLFDIDLTCKLTPAYYSVGLPDPQPVRVGLP